MAKILLVEDDPEVSATISEWLGFSHHTVEKAGDGLTGLEMLLCSEFDLAILDWNLPGLNGPEIVKQVRAKSILVPIIMLTARAAMADKVDGLDSGADDYLTKPVNIHELNARIRSLLRRASSSATNTLKLRGLELDPAKLIATRDGIELNLLPREFAVLEFLMRHPDEVFSADALIERVWTSDTEATADAIRTCIKRLRKKIGDDARDSSGIIQTVFGVGYRLRSR